MTKQQFIARLQSHAARTAIGGSTVRGKGNTGVAEKARAFLRHMDLAQFGTSDEQAFRSVLDRNTEALRRHLPGGAQHWGIARKALNIYLRNCLYTCYIRDAFHLEKAEEFFEVPLDSYTAAAIRKNEKLPRWRGVKHLTPEMSALLQATARKKATSELAPVHLDAKWWSEERDAN